MAEHVERPTAAGPQFAVGKTLSGAVLTSLQRTVGNRAVNRILVDRGRGGMPVVGSADDPAEREADRIGQQILRRVGEAVSISSPPPPGDQRDRGATRTASTAVGKSVARRFPLSDMGAEGGPVPDRVATGLRGTGPGVQLHSGLQESMEAATASDLSKVRVHYASDLPGEIGAAAFTLGSEIHLGPAASRMGSQGRQVLAHEVAHVLQGGQVIRRYFDGWEAEGEDVTRKEQFVSFLENAVKAGVPADTAEGAGLETLQHFEGWSHPFVTDFEYAFINGKSGFRTKLTARLEGLASSKEALAALLAAVFNTQSNAADLERLGRVAGFTPGAGAKSDDRLELDPEDERQLLTFYADRFESRGDWKGQGPIFKKAWASATDKEKRRILVILLGPDWEQGAEPASSHLSDLSYLIEGVTGKTPGSPRHIQDWAGNPRGSLFGYMAALPTGYKTRYMTKEERERYHLTITGGHVTLPDRPLAGDNIFVLSAANVFYGGDKQSGLGKADKDFEAIHHSSFMAGEPVHGAGHLITDSAGTLQKVTDQSGHYAPTEYEVGLVIYQLKHLGVDLQNLKLRIGTKERNAMEFMQDWTKKFLPAESVSKPPAEENTAVNL